MNQPVFQWPSGSWRYRQGSRWPVIWLVSGLSLGWRVGPAIAQSSSAPPKAATAVLQAAPRPVVKSVDRFLVDRFPGSLPNQQAALLLPEEPLAIATDPSNAGETLDLDPQIIESSPVLQRWLEAVPDVAHDVKYDPAFRTRLRVGYATFPSTDHTSGVHLGVEDVFVGRTPLTIRAEYTGNARGDRTLLGIDAQYYILPLGWYSNVAPVVGYRAIDTPTFSQEGVNVGVRIILIPSRTGAVDVTLSQTWVTPGTETEIGLTNLSVGYAVTPTLRLATDIQTQNTPERQESRVSLLLEWMP